MRNHMSKHHNQMQIPRLGLLWRRYRVCYTCGFVDDVMFSYNRPMWKRVTLPRHPRCSVVHGLTPQIRGIGFAPRLDESFVQGCRGGVSDAALPCVRYVTRTCVTTWCHQLATDQSCGPRIAVGPMCACVCVFVWTITFELNDPWSRQLICSAGTCRFSLTVFWSSLMIQFISQSLWSLVAGRKPVNQN